MNRIAMYFFSLLLVSAVACSGEDPSENQDVPDAGTEDAAEDVVDLEAPTLESILPVEGSTDGGEEVSLYGTNFVEASVVWFGDTAVATTYVSSTELTATTPASEPGTVDVFVENPDGQLAILEDAFEFLSDDPPLPEIEIGWCNLQYPAATTTEINVETEGIYGRVYAEDCTDTDDCTEITAQLGWGGDDVDASTDPDAWDWIDAERNMAFEDENDYEYEATITADAAGTYAYAYRFSADDGESWTYCDLEGSDNGFAPEEAGELAVTEEEPDETVEIGWCNLQHPESTTTDASVETEPIYGRVFVEDCTGEDQCENVDAQLGVGPDDGDPTTDAAAYDWLDAEYNSGHEGDDNDEYTATATISDTGTYTYVYRFSGDDGDSWIYCDLDGSDDGFDPDRMGELVVE